MKIAHLADVHLDASFTLFPSEKARARRHSLEGALREALSRAAGEQVDAILIAGDLYEHERVSPNTGEFLRSAFEEVAPLPIFIAPGNHDWYGRQSLYARLEWPGHVHVFSSDRLEPYDLADGLTLWGSAHRAPANTDDFLSGFRVDRSGVNIALFHGSEQGAFTFQEEGKVAHAPFRADEIEASGLAHVFCGHFHTPVDHDRFTYPGNPEPLTFAESATPPRGLVLATIGGEGAVSRERVRVAQTSVTDVGLDVTGCTSGNEVREKARAELEGLSGYVRLSVSGELAPEVDLRLDDLTRVAPKLDAVVVRAGHLSTGYDLQAIKSEGTVRGEFVNDVLASELSDEAKRQVVLTGLRALEGRADLEVV